MSIDLYGASLEIYFKTKNGTPKTLRNIVFGETTSVHDVSYVNFVQHVRVKVSVVNMTEMEITLTPPFDEAVALIQSGVIGLGFSAKTSTGAGTSVTDGDSELSSPSDASIDFNTVIVKLFYGGKESPYFKGLLLPPELAINTEGITITLKAIGMLFPQTKQAMKQAFEDKTRLEIIQQAMGNDVEVSIAPGDAKCTELLNSVEKLNATETNMSVIKKLLDKSNCVLVDKGVKSPTGTPVFEIVSKDHMRKKRDTSAIFVLWNQIDPNNGIFPITNLDTTINNVLLGQTLGINTMSVDTSTKTISVAEEENSNSNTIKYTDRNSSPDGTQANGGGSVTSDQLVSKPGPNQGETHNYRDTLLGIVQNATDSSLQYKLETIGLVDLLPGRTVTVRIGDIPFLSGAYDLYEVEHEFSTDGVVTRMNLARTAGLASLINKGVEKVQGAASAAAANNKSSTDITRSPVNI